MTETIIPNIDKEDWARRIIDLIPRDWFSEEARQPGGKLYALMSGVGVDLERTIDNIQYDKLASRIKSATDEALDSVAKDYFGIVPDFPVDVIRFPGEPDDSFRQRILSTLFLSAVTREALEQVLQRLTGKEPRLLEPWRVADNAVLNGWSYLDVDSKSAPGRLADPTLRYQGFVESPLPPYSPRQGANVLWTLDRGASLNRSAYLMNPSPSWWLRIKAMDNLINKTKVFGTKVWRKYSNNALTRHLLGGTLRVGANTPSKQVTVFPPFAGQYIIMASASWNSAIACSPTSNAQFNLTFSTPPEEVSGVDWIACPITDTRVGLVAVPFQQSFMTIGVSQHPNQRLLVCPSWNTNYWLSDLDLSLATVQFSMPAPEKAALSYYYFDVDKSAVADVPEDATELDVLVIPAHNPYQLFILPTWNTVCKVTKSDGSFKVSFETPAPVGSKLYWAVHQS